MPLKSHKYILLFAILALGSLVGCTSKTNLSVLAFFFDGVPDPNETNVTISADSLLMTDSLAISDNHFAPTSPFIFHQPYEQKECDICHNNAYMGQLTETQPELCYNCHVNFANEYQYVHGPAEGGFCTNCHNPHLSKLESLLLAEGQEICISCHEAKEVFKTDIHKGFEEENCLECHNPHGGKTKGYLTESDPGLCYKCHDDFNQKYAFVHGPVAGGNCSTCHGAHSDNSGFLLLRTGQPMCLQCHEAEWVFKNDAHEGIEDYSCTECHNPHGGDNKYYN